jgi:hypothetical protein
MNIKVSITKDNVLTNQHIAESMEAAQAWLDYHEGMKSFGEPARTVQQQVELSPAVLNEDGSVLQEAVTEMQEVHIPGSYQVEILDITSQLEQEAINAQSMAFLSECDWKRQRHISQKALGIATSLSDEEYLTMEAACQAAREAIVD